MRVQAHKECKIAQFNRVKTIIFKKIFASGINNFKINLFMLVKFEEHILIWFTHELCFNVQSQFDQMLN